MTDPSPAVPTRRTVAIVMAAGLGTRMKSTTPKVLHRVCGRTIVEWVIDAAVGATGNRPLVVYSPATDGVREAVAGLADTVLQEVPRGTGDAVRSALAALSDDVDEVLVLNGDVPLMKAELLAALVDARRLDQAALALVAVDAIDPSGLGRVVRNEGGTVERIVEEKDATEDELGISEINAGLYAVDAAWLRRRIADLQPSPTTGELYVTELVSLARADGRLVAALDVEDDGRLTGINDRAQLAHAEWDMRVEINDRWMRAGVTMEDPSTAYVDHGVQLGEDVTLEPNVILRGATVIGRGTRIGAGSQIYDSTIGEGCVVWASVVEKSTVEDAATVGPMSHLRPGAHVGRRSEVGNFAEIKNSRLGEHVRQHHMSYLGDAELGADTNVGAGTITANYDGVRKHRTTIGERVFLGVDTMLRAPVTLGDGSKTGAGAVVTRDVPAGKLAVGVPARIRDIRPPEAANSGERSGEPEAAAAASDGAARAAAGSDGAAGVADSAPAPQPAAGAGEPSARTEGAAG